MPLLHWVGVVQGWPVGTPQVPATQKPELHSWAAVHVVRLGALGVQVPLEQ